MKKITVLAMALCVLLIGFAIGSSQAQQAVNNRMAGRVEQGGILAVTLTVNKSPSIPISVTATASANNGQNYNFTAGCGIDPGGTRCDASALVPLDAPTGRWTISKVQMQPRSGGAPTVLSETGDISFRMLPHGSVTLPTSVTVSGIK